MDRLTILLVEDDEFVRAVTADLLTELGYQVREAATATAALAALDPAPEILITDIGLPDGNGNDLAHRVHARAPGTAIVISSGDTARPAAFTSLSKPYDTATLARAIEAARTAVKPP